jgi:plasmid stabilization system protein ParE
MKIEFLPPARAELTDAISYYNIQSEGLGFEFAAEVKRTLERIVRHPDAWLRLSKRTRRCRTNRFPYGINYQDRKEMLLIVAVMHMSREPETWKSRLKPKEL